MQLEQAIKDSVAFASTSMDFAADFYSIDGMSGKRFRCFINHLIKGMPGSSYLEIGLWGGSTFCSAISGNCVRAFGIDDWSGIDAVQGKIPAPKTEFHDNLQRTLKESPLATVTLIEQKFREVNYSLHNPFDVYFFDGPHLKDDQSAALRCALPALKDNFIFIVDDWNWPDVQSGTAAAIRDTGVTIVHDISIKTASDGSYYPGTELDPWHNGYWIAVLRKSIAPRDGEGRTSGSP